MRILRKAEKGIKNKTKRTGNPKYGEDHAGHIYKDELVDLIRQSPFKGKNLARYYNMSESQVSKIKNNKSRANYD